MSSSSMSKRRKRRKTEEGQPSELVITPPPNYFPVELVEEILSNLPTLKFLTRFRTLSKHFNSVLASPSFVRKFLFQNSDSWNDSQVVIQRRKDERSVFTFHSLHSLRFKWEGELSDGFEIRWGCKGLFCLTKDDGNGISSIALWNLATSQMKLLPRSKHRFRASFEKFGRKIERIGFGFDPNSDDYKVVRSVYSHLQSEDGAAATITLFTELYSLKNDAWRILDRHLACNFPLSAHYSVPSFDGRFFYWCTGDSRFARFDMSREAFDCIEAEDVVLAGPGQSPLLSFTMVKELLVCMFIKGDSLETWMYDYFQENQMQLSTTKLKDLLGFPVGMWKNGKCFFQRSDNGKLIIIDLESGETIPSELQIEGDWQSIKIFPYTPSRVSLV